MIPQKIFDYFAEQHDLLLTETEYADILNLIKAEALTSKELQKSIYANHSVEGNSIKECEHRHKVWVTQIAEMYCPECREIL